MPSLTPSTSTPSSRTVSSLRTPTPPTLAEPEFHSVSPGSSPSRIVEKNFMSEIDEPEVIDIIRKIRSKTNGDTSDIPFVVAKDISSKERISPPRRPHEDTELTGIEQPLESRSLRSTSPKTTSGSKPIPKLKPPTSSRSSRRSSHKKSTGGSTLRSFSPKPKTNNQAKPPISPSNKKRTALYSAEASQENSVSSYHVEVQTDRTSPRRSPSPRVSQNTVLDFVEGSISGSLNRVSSSRTAPLAAVQEKIAKKRTTSRSAAFCEDPALSPEFFRTLPVTPAASEPKSRIRTLSSLLICGAGETLDESPIGARMGNSLGNISTTAKDMFVRAQSQFRKQRKNGNNNSSFNEESSFYREGDTNFFDEVEESVITGGDTNFGDSTMGGDSTTMFTLDQTVITNYEDAVAKSAKDQPGCTNVLKHLWKDIRGENSFEYDSDEDGETMDGTLNTGMGSVSLAETSVSSNSLVMNSSRDPHVKYGRTSRGRLMVT